MTSPNGHGGSWITIDLNKVACNIQSLRRLPACPRLFAAVIKADAYGLGANIVAQYLQSRAVVDAFTVALVDEAIALRSAGITMPILITAGSFFGAYEAVIRHGLIPIVGNEQDIIEFARVAQLLNVTIPMHIELDAGMARHGFCVEELSTVKQLVSELASVNVIGVMTHPMYCGGSLTGVMQAQIARTLDTVQSPNRCLPLLLSSGNAGYGGAELKRLEVAAAAAAAAAAEQLASPSDNADRFQRSNSSTDIPSLSSPDSSHSSWSWSYDNEESESNCGHSMASSYSCQSANDVSENFQSGSHNFLPEMPLLNTSNLPQDDEKRLTLHFTNSSLLAASSTSGSSSGSSSDNSSFVADSECPSSLYAPGSGDMARIGLAMYGIQPFDPTQSTDFFTNVETVVTWQTHVVAVRTIAAGKSVGYDATWRAKRQTRVATLCVGYADGYPRSLSNKAEVLIAGKRAPVIGRVCMDYTMIDVSDIDVEEVNVGTHVTLMGAACCESSLPPPNTHTHAAAAPSAWEVAHWADTIPYEILSRISPRVKRCYAYADGISSKQQAHEKASLATKSTLSIDTHVQMYVTAL